MPSVSRCRARGEAPDHCHLAVAAAGGAARVRCFLVALLVRGQRPKGRCPTMQRCADRIMNGLKGGGVVIRTERGQDPVAAAVELLQQDQVFSWQQSAAPCQYGVRQFGDASSAENLVLWTVSTLWVMDWAVPVPDWPRFRMFRRESSVGRGWNPVRVPPRAQCFLRSEAC
jgi:hypothetical protein